ncbi:MAG: NAD(P)/FAD-dependent oxidoreductase [Candidatus Paceibacterota bacterium]
MSTKPHIVIVGAGFGGLYTAKYLIPYVKKGVLDITLINKTNYFLFTPLLHEVATGGLHPTSISEALREIFKKTGITIYQDIVISINTSKKVIQTENCEIPYDYVVLATGAETNYYNIPGAKENSLGLKNLEDAVNIRQSIIDSFEKATLTKDENERKKLLSFVVVGGGATGVETVSEIAEFACEIKNRYYKGDKKYHVKDISISLINTGPEILKPFHPKIQKIAAKRLEEMGVTLLLSKMVSSVSPGTIHFSDESTLSANTIVWATGVTPSTPKCMEHNAKFVGGRLETDEFLRMIDMPNIFVLGDSACVTQLNGNPPPPMLAQVAVSEAKIVARNIIASIKNKKLSKFIYKSKGTLVSLGQWFAAGKIFSFVISGKIAWWIWRTVYLFKFLSWEKRIHIAFEWTLDIFYPRDITKIR